MKFPKKTITEEFLDKSSKLRGPNKDLQAAAMMLRDAAARVDHKLVNRSTNLAHRLLLSLKKALPETDPQLIGDFVAEVSDLWDYGQKLDTTLKELCDMRLPQHQGRMGEALVAIEVQQFDYALDCIKGLQKTLPKLKQALDRQAKNGRPKSKV
jgi:hypothetical protein